MLSYWRNYRKINRSMADGQLNIACALARRTNLGDNLVGRQLGKRLVHRLMKRAGQKVDQGKLEGAWKDLFDAASIAIPPLSDEVSKQSNQLVESTIQVANELLVQGQISQAVATARMLTERRILDQRADRIHRIGEQLQLSKQMAARGEIDQARSVVYNIWRRHPELPFLEQEMKKLEKKQRRLADMTLPLLDALQESAWGRLRRLAAPWLGLSTEETPPQEKADPSGQQNQAHETAPWKATRCKTPAQSDEARKPSMRCFMLWIDGVGGYLVCREPEVLIGRAVPASQVDIPLQAEVERRHLKIRRLDNSYLVEPLGTTYLNDRRLTQPSILGHRQYLTLQGGVSIQFHQPNPIGNSARLEIASRHRTEPWADAIVLLGDALVLGPDRNQVLCCSRWSQDRMIFRRDEKIYFRSPGVFDVNGKMQTGDIELTDKIHLSGDDFSITCESVGAEFC